MKRVAVALLFALSPLGALSPVAVAEPAAAPAPARPKRLGARDLGLLASIILMPWSTMPLFHGGHARKKPSRAARNAANDRHGPVVNGGSAPAHEPAAAPSSEQASVQ